MREKMMQKLHIFDAKSHIFDVILKHVFATFPSILNYSYPSEKTKWENTEFSVFLVQDAMHQKWHQIRREKIDDSEGTARKLWVWRSTTCPRTARPRSSFWPCGTASTWTAGGWGRTSWSTRSRSSRPSHPRKQGEGGSSVRGTRVHESPRRLSRWIGKRSQAPPAHAVYGEMSWWKHTTIRRSSLLSTIFISPGVRSELDTP